MRLVSSCERKPSVELELESKSMEEINQNPIGPRDDLADHLHSFVYLIDLLNHAPVAFCARSLNGKLRRP
jgi:hypothetical protein